MQAFHNSTAFAFALTAIAALVAALHTPAANAMGHSGARVASSNSSVQAVARANPTEAGTQAQIEALRREVEELKEQLAIVKGGATAE
jgi:TolA-binding protein